MIKLSPLLKEHLNFLLEVRNHETTRHNLENNNVFNLEECEKWYETSNPAWYIISYDDTMVGYIRTNGDEVGCDIHPKYRRNGYARQAYKLILQEIGTVSLWVFDDNFAKILYLDLGFKETGEQKMVRNRKYIKMIYNNEK